MRVEKVVIGLIEELNEDLRRGELRGERYATGE
jgi:hypothetical protein